MAAAVGATYERYEEREKEAPLAAAKSPDGRDFEAPNRPQGDPRAPRTLKQS